jgi:eukaryotic-like serine/threonine-protein kinase
MSNELSREYCKPRAGFRFTVNAVEYELGGELGDGAIGIVRKVSRLKDGHQYAIKFLAPDPKYIDESAFSDVAARFKREGERGTKLSHPNLLRIFAYQENSGGSNFESKYPVNPFLLMERVDGKSLESYIRRRPGSERGKFIVSRDRLLIAIQIANAVADLHRSRLIHRDIKPANVFLFKSSGSGHMSLTKLGDFGIVKWGDFHASLSTGVLTATNQRGLGTLKYMSPEQAIAPKDLSVRSDIYSLGITLFELFTSQILASPHHVFEIMNARLLRGTTASRFFSMGYRLSEKDENIAAMLLDMHRRGPTGRPAIDRIKGILEHEFDARYNRSWEEAVDWSAENRYRESWDD